MDNNTVEERLLSSEALETNDLKRRIWNESKLIWRIAFPGVVARVSSFGVIVVTQLFLGHIDEIDIAAYALVQTIVVRFVMGLLIGMSSATETLCGQAFGAGQYHMMGIYLQRSWIIDAFITTIFLPILIFASPIFIAIGQTEKIAVEAETISLWFIPILYSLVFALTIQMYLQAQLKNMVIGWISAASFVLHLFLSWIFVYQLDFGVSGAMGALTIASWSVVIGEFVYIFGGWCPNTWKGFTKAAFSDLLPVIKLSISSGIMLCLELWYNAVLVLLAGYMENAAIAISAFSICLNINAWEFMICLGFLGAACVRVSNELGKGNAKAARFAIKAILGTSLCIGLFFWALCLAFGRQISYLFTSNEEVAEYVSNLSVLLSFSILLNSIQPVLTGVAVGAGLQSRVAVVNLGCYYLVGIPVGALLGYVAGLQVTGLWIGMLIGILLQTLILSYIVWRTDWDDQVKKASERLNQWLVKSSDESNNDSTDA
ncbi:MatE domain-containing protein [Cephalotus follicularis]|uniref:Protein DETOXIFICATION n=1 Tax=Cephalotus follicularis TaxID=3775 RepID=A0A1Q3AP00_CEPFO|nr:MatE domain-containing protein [Cephalotus follicularis]